MLFTGPEEKVPQTGFQTRSKQISHRNKQDERPLQRERPQIERGAGDKAKKVIKENYGEQSDEFKEFILTDDRELLESSTTDAINELTTFDEDQVKCDVTRKHVYENLSG